MGVGFRTRRGVMLGLLAAGFVSVGMAQSAVTLTEPSGPLLPQSFGEWRSTGQGGATPGYSLANTNKDALEECGPQRSAVMEYTRGGKTVHVEAVQFGDRTGAYSAYTLVERAGMRVGKELGSSDAVGDGAVLFTQGSTLVLANFVSGDGEVAAADVAALKPLAEVLPKVSGSKGVFPLLPTLAPTKGLVAGSLRYALGPATYSGDGGVLPANSLGWDKEPEAVTALYDDARGKETLTLIVYPTPMIAGSFTREIQGELPQMGPKFATAKVRREGPLVILADGTYTGDEAQRMVENVHLRQDVSFDKDVQPVFRVEAGKTYSLLANIVILSGVLMLAAVLLGLFLGVGRAAFRVMRGKPAAVEPEFLSLHLSPQNEAPKFTDAG